MCKARSKRSIFTSLLCDIYIIIFLVCIIVRVNDLFISFIAPFKAVRTEFMQDRDLEQKLMQKLCGVLPTGLLLRAFAHPAFLKNLGPPAQEPSPINQ